MQRDCKLGKEKIVARMRLVFIFTAVLCAGVQALAQPHTFVFFLNGAEDHVVPRNHAVRGEFFDAVNSDFDQIRSNKVDQANVVCLYVSKYEARLLVMSGSDAHEESLVNVQLSNLLEFAQTWFPNTSLHLVYRGHGIAPGEFEPFRQQLEIANINLASVTFAACSMSYIEIAGAIAPWARYMIASQVDVVETAQAGFDYSFIGRAAADYSSGRVAFVIASTILASFSREPYVEEKMKEQPVTLVDLTEFGACFDKLCHLLDFVQEVCPDLENTPGRVTKDLSNLKVRCLRAKYGPEQVERFVQVLRAPSSNPQQWDLLSFLKAIVLGPHRAECEALQEELGGRITVFDRCDRSTKCGLSLQLGALSL